MNILSFSGFFTRLHHRLMFHARLLDTKTRSHSFVAQKNTKSIERIYVINLDRKPDRWSQISRELKRIRNWSGEQLFSITRRFSAVDARYLKKETDNTLLHTEYSLADQLLVDPNPRVNVDEKSKAHRISMTPQEIAVALSHIEVWKLIASSNIPYTLVLEDDVYFRRGFSRDVDKLWRSAMNRYSEGATFDLLYLSFTKVGIHVSSKRRSTKLIDKPDSGIWQASGYVLSRSGAKKLIALLPAYGPIDLWLNLQFGKIDVLITQQPIIEQRVDVLSSNSYSIMPVLSQIGVYTHEKPLVAHTQSLLGPIFAYGESGSGLTGLARALSMLSYTCCSDLLKFPNEDIVHNRNFSAYVNVGSLNEELLSDVIKAYPSARFIFTTYPSPQLPSAIRSRVLYLPYEHSDKWSALTKFLELEYPAFSYPICDEVGQRGVASFNNQDKNILPFKHLRFDSSPWIIASKSWTGIYIDEVEQDTGFKLKIVSAWSDGRSINNSQWKLRDDTFPSNLALFTPNNAKISESGVMKLKFQKQNTPVRSFTSAAVVARQAHLYGRFSAEIRPANVSGLITGIFLHRNSPHQEIDIEFVGKDTTKMLINVFYNPGVESTKLEYGYRGTPTVIELGFNAAKEFHEYAIEWYANTICWCIDGQVVHKRVLWDPTPIPDLPMEFNINLWHSRSRELVGALDTLRIPAEMEIKSIRIMQ